MSEQVGFVQEGVDRFRDAFDSIDGGFQKVQKELKARRSDIERQLDSGRRDFERRTRKEVKRVRTQLRKNPLLKRADGLRKDATRQIESSVDSFLGIFQIASKSDVDRIDRRIAQLTRKLKEIERAKKSNGGVAL